MDEKAKRQDKKMEMCMGRGADVGGTYCSSKDVKKYIEFVLF